MGPNAEFVESTARRSSRRTALTPKSRIERSQPGARRSQSSRPFGAAFWVGVLPLLMVLGVARTEGAPESDPVSSPAPTTTAETNTVDFSASAFFSPTTIEPVPDYFQQQRTHRTARELQEKYRLRVPIHEAVGDDVEPLPGSRATNEPPARPPSLAVMLRLTRQNLMIAGLILLVGVLALRAFAPDVARLFNPRFNPWALSASSLASLSAKVRAEDDAFSEFLTAFYAGPGARSGKLDLAFDSAMESDPLKVFLRNSPKLLGELRQLLQELNRVTSVPARRKCLADLHRELHELRGEAGLSELLPVWQMAAALEGLIKQLMGKAGNVTPSTLRTVTAGFDVLADLCRPGVRPDLLTNPPLRLLAVDDDLISRKAVSLALKKALTPPDLAVDGPAALALATQHAYDVVFLDVQMPGMDGFEVCTKIHETIPNATTPVVFVTCQSDFDARAQATLSGGHDLIAKPFLTFEITVKALTLALQGRLQGRVQTIVGLGELAPNKPAVLTEDEHSSQMVTSDQTAMDSFQAEDAEAAARRHLSALAATESASRVLAPSNKTTPDDLARAFLSRAAVSLGPLRELIQTIFQTKDEALRQDMLADFYLRLTALATTDAALAGHPALRLIAALEGLLKKLLECPKHATPSSLFTVTTAVDLLVELCAEVSRADFLADRPIQLLVVDDDPVARRAITCALQMAFGKPETAENGEAALALAMDNPYDAIFLDVQMPGLDGFATCIRIHETVHNRTTPVVFVTGHSDFKARSQASFSGGSDLIAKPFLKAEVIVKALTFALRGRMQQRKMAQNLMLLPTEKEAKPDALSSALAG